MSRKSRLLHKWIGLFSCIFIFIVSLTAVALNHQDLYLRFLLKEEAKADFSASDIKALDIDPFDNSHIIASDMKSLFQSFDSGKNWEELKLFVPAEKVNNINFSPAKQDLIYISLREAGVFYSDDGGYVWEQVSIPFFPPEGEYIEYMSLAKDKLILKTKYAIYSLNTFTDKWDNMPFKNIDKSKALNIGELIYDLHTGKFFGYYGKYLYDIISIGLVILSFTGIILSLKSSRLKKRKKENVQQKKTELMQEAGRT